METSATNLWLFVCVFVLTLTATIRALADRAAEPAKFFKTCTGVVVSVDTKNQVITVKHWPFGKRSLNLGEHCFYSLPGKIPAGIGDLRAGQKVAIAYQNAPSMLVADRVKHGQIKDQRIK